MLIIALFSTYCVIRPADRDFENIFSVIPKTGLIKPVFLRSALLPDFTNVKPKTQKQIKKKKKSLYLQPLIRDGTNI